MKLTPLLLLLLVLGRVQDATAAERDITSTPVLPAAWELGDSSHWRVGMMIEQSFTQLLAKENISNTRAYGVSVNYRNHLLSPNMRLIILPRERVQESFAAFGGGVRAYYRLLGVELSYGIGAHIESRLKDHYWLAWATPAEIGATLYETGSWRIAAFAGFRQTFAGALINHFIIDPNGFDNESASTELTMVRAGTSQTFLSIVFARQL